jgi:hypothetical protein
MTGSSRSQADEAGQSETALDKRKEALSDRMEAVFGDLSARPAAFAANG